MGLVDRLFRKNARQQASEVYDRALNSMMGIEGQASISRRGYPVCPKCKSEFPISAAQMREQSDGIPSFKCVKCGKMIRL